MLVVLPSVYILICTRTLQPLESYKYRRNLANRIPQHFHSHEHKQQEHSVKVSPFPGYTLKKLICKMVIVGKYELVDSERYDDYLKSVGAGIREREHVRKFRPLIEYEPTPDGKWKQRTTLGLKNYEICFAPGEEFNELFYGTKLKSQITIEGNRLIQKQRVGSVEATVIREFNGNEMFAIFSVGDTVATRVYRKVA